MFQLKMLQKARCRVAVPSRQFPKEISSPKQALAQPRALHADGVDLEDKE
ncbi:hypothetical protein [Mesorhizobium sp. B2-4-12]|nr:hypothetical protein [Mesorhizobium sp. B2-4-12]